MPKTFSSPSQLLVPISEIKEGVISLKNGGLRSVLLVSSVNFALKSNEEQEAIINRFQDFLNSVDFSVQIIVQSRKLNIGPYLKNIKEMEKSQENELLRVQTAEYHDFVKELVESTNIMNKSFYVVVPYSLGENAKKKGVFSLLKEATSPSKGKIEDKRFSQLKAQLWQRVDHVASSLSAMSMRAIPLNTEELIELFYEAYNPGGVGERNLGSPDEMGLKK
jgi:hypothetical protein